MWRMRLHRWSREEEEWYRRLCRVPVLATGKREEERRGGEELVYPRENRELRS